MSTMDFLYLESSAEMSILYMQLCTFLICNNVHFYYAINKAAVAMMPDAELEVPYEGAKEMLLVDNVDDKEFLCSLLEAMYDELPVPKKKK